MVTSKVLAKTYLTKDELAEVKRAAEARRMSVSAFLAFAVLKEARAWREEILRAEHAVAMKARSGVETRSGAKAAAADRSRKSR